MKKNDVVAKISESLSLDKKICKKVLDQYLVLIKESLVAGEMVNINQVGTIQRVMKKERELFSPKKGVKISLKSHYSLKFKMSKSIKKDLDSIGA